MPNPREDELRRIVEAVARSVDTAKLAHELQGLTSPPAPPPPPPSPPPPPPRPPPPPPSPRRSPPPSHCRSRSRSLSPSLRPPVPPPPRRHPRRLDPRRPGRRQGLPPSPSVHLPGRVGRRQRRRRHRALAGLLPQRLLPGRHGGGGQDAPRDRDHPPLLPVLQRAHARAGPRLPGLQAPGDAPEQRARAGPLRDGGERQGL